jgi:hypothetical protein
MIILLSLLINGGSGSSVIDLILETLSKQFLKSCAKDNNKI